MCCYVYMYDIEIKQYQNQDFEKKIKCYKQGGNFESPGFRNLEN